MRIFVDTNVLIRSTIASYPLHLQAQALVSRMQEEADEAWISRQVIREFIAQLTRGQAEVQALPIRQIISLITKFETQFKIADEDAVVTRQLMTLLELHSSGGKQIHDANIVATMLVHQIDTLLTLNVEDMKRFSSEIKIVSLTSEES
jgi:predicted nucleic acid-binding protein